MIDYFIIFPFSFPPDAYRLINPRPSFSCWLLPLLAGRAVAAFLRLVAVYPPIRVIIKATPTPPPHPLPPGKSNRAENLRAASSTTITSETR